MNENIAGPNLIIGVNLGPYLLTTESNDTGEVYTVVLRYKNNKIIERSYSKDLEEKDKKKVELDYKKRAELDYDLVHKVLLHYNGVNPVKEQCDYDLIERN